MKLYYDPITVNCRKVLAGMALLGAEYETGKIDYFAGGHKEPGYTAINPNASIPALVHGDFVLWESNAILQYAADKQGPSSAYPQDAKVRADISRWFLWEASQWFPSCYVYLVEHLVQPMTGGQTDMDKIAAQDPIFHHLASILEQRLEHQPWLCGDEVTLADIAVAAPMHLHSYQKLPLDSHPHLAAWMERVEALPCWVSTDPRPLLGLT